ncbi:hypothetical protein TIFTF001_055180 [Ficus carica]|nr:hypothetical protein TIFTF001_055180 [Ficus carica]
MNAAGACEYGSLALGLSGGHIAGAVPSIYKDGAGCDFVLSSRAFRALAKKGLDQDVLKLGIVDVEYKR